MMSQQHLSAAMEGRMYCGSNDSATRRVMLPDMPDFSDDDSDGEEEDSAQWEKRQAGKFGVHSIGVKIGTHQGNTGRHIEFSNIIESPRKRKTAVDHNVEGHSGDE